MGDSDLDEVEDCSSYMDNYQSIDIDVAFSDIDQRIQEVLGEHQKEIEAGISVDNLGARSGSFLPTTYQRSSSIWPLSRTPQKGQCQSNFVDDRHLEDALRNTTIFMRPEPTSTDLPLSEVRNSSVDTLPKIQNSGDSASSSKPLKLPTSPDKKTLKLRIKVASENVLDEANSAIYNILGLDLSPSLASEGSPAEWEGSAADFHGDQCESPSGIIKIMTSFPIPDSVLLSPLHGSLVCLMEQKNLLDGCRSGPVQEGSAVFENEAPSKTNGKKLFGVKKRKLGNHDRTLVEPENGSYEDAVNLVDADSKRGKDEDLSQNAVICDNWKLPCKSRKLCKGNGMGDEAGVAPKGDMRSMKDRFFFPNGVIEETLGSKASRTNEKQNANNSWAGSFQKDKRVGCDLRNDGCLDLFEAHCNVSKGSKVYNWGTVAPRKLNCGTEANIQQDGREMSLVKELSLSGREKKSKGSQNYGSSATSKSKERSMVSSSLTAKDNITCESFFQSKSNRDDKLDNSLRTAKDSFSDSTDNKKLVKKQHRSGMLRASPKDLAKDSMLEVSGKILLTFRDKFKVGSSKDQVKDSDLEVCGKKSRALSNQSEDTSGKDQSKDCKFEVSGNGLHGVSTKLEETRGKGLAKNYKLQLSEKESYAFSKKLKERLSIEKNYFPSSSAPHMQGHSKEATTLLPIMISPVVIKENWVCCDECHKWRLLPYGRNPDHLPKKWLCSMLNWLPGMNFCSVSEEETTNSLNALYQVPDSEPLNDQQTFAVEPASRGNLVAAQHLNKNFLDISFSAVPSRGKKKLGARAISNVSQYCGSVDTLNCKKKSQQFPVKNKGFQNPRQDSLELILEKRSNDARPWKKKTRKVSDEDGFRPPRRTETESMHYTDVGQNPDGLLIKEVQTDIQKYIESCSIDVKAVSPEVLFPSVKRSRKQFQKTIAVEDHCKSSTAGKKIKLKDQKNTRIHLDDLPSDRHITKDELISKEDASGKECRKEKAIESKFAGEETGKAYGEVEERSKVTKIFLSSRTNNPLDCNSPYKGGKTSTKDHPLGCCDEYNLSVGVICGNSSSGRDLGVGQPCIAATSSSSMISGTGKTEVNSPKFEGSPAESVCSSPLRISNQENLTGSLSLDEGDADTGLSLINSHGRYSVGEGDGGRNPSELTRKEKAFSMIQHGSSVSPLFDYRDGLIIHKVHMKPKSLTVYSSKITNSNASSDRIDDDEQNNRHCYEPRANHHFHYMERVNNHRSPNKSLPEKCRNSCSSRAKKRQSTPIFDFDKSGIRTTELVNEQEELETLHYGVKSECQDFSPYKKDLEFGEIKIHGNKSTKGEKNHAGEKVSAGKCFNDHSKGEKRVAYDGFEDPYWKRDTVCLKNGKSAIQNLQQNQNDEKSSEQLPLERTCQVELVAGNGGDCEVLPAHGSDGGDSAKGSQQHGKDNCQKGLDQVHSRHPTCNREGIKDIVPTSHGRKDESTYASNNAMKEAKDLKHSADCLKVSGSRLESTEVCFQAALKFLHGAALLDPHNRKSAKYGDIMSTAAYNTTAKLCEFCGTEYERCKDMASATLAYKCMEVAYMRVIYSNHFIASADRHELQTTLQPVSPVESPSSCASDADDLNNQAMLDKVDMAKDGSSSKVTGNHVISARTHPSLLRLLNFAQDVNFAMEASTKSQIAFAATNDLLAETGKEECISPIKRVLDLSFHDIDELLRLVRLAMEALSRVDFPNAK